MNAIVERDGPVWTVTPLDHDGLRVPEDRRRFATETQADAWAAELEQRAESARQGIDPEYGDSSATNSLRGQLLTDAVWCPLCGGNHGPDDGQPGYSCS